MLPIPEKSTENGTRDDDKLRGVFVKRKAKKKEESLQSRFQMRGWREDN